MKARKLTYEDVRTLAKLIFADEYDRYERHCGDLYGPTRYRRPNPTDTLWSGLEKSMRDSYMQTARSMICP